MQGNGIGHAQALCPAGTKLTGGGAIFVDVLVSLGGSYPISNTDGAYAFGTTAIGWQAITSNFEGEVFAFAICAGP